VATATVDRDLDAATFEPACTMFGDTGPTAEHYIGSPAYPHGEIDRKGTAVTDDDEHPATPPQPAHHPGGIAWGDRGIGRHDGDLHAVHEHSEHLGGGNPAVRRTGVAGTNDNGPLECDAGLGSRRQAEIRDIGDCEPGAFLRGPGDEHEGERPCSRPRGGDDTAPHQTTIGEHIDHRPIDGEESITSEKCPTERGDTGR
jgi:hypothetical protein